MTFFEKIWIPFAVLLLFGVNNSSYGQFYVSPKVCVNENQPDPNNPGQSIGCSQATTFFDTLGSSVAWNWDFGDGNTATTRDPKHFYNTPGTFIVNLRNVDNNGVINNFTKTLTVGTYPNQPKFNDKVDTDTTVCDGSTLKLNPFKGNLAGNNYEYLWFPNGETTSTIEVDTSGCYSVEVKDKTTGCSRSARIKVKFCLQEKPSGSPVQKEYLNGGVIIEYKATSSPPDPIDSLASEGNLINSLDSLSDSSAGREIAQKHKLVSNGANTIVYDKSGNLVLYSDGIKIYSGKDESEIKMVDGSPYIGLNGNSTSSIYLIPKNSCNSCEFEEYYLFTVNLQTGLLSYTVIDMRYNNKKGAITDVNVPVLYPVTPSMTVTANFDNTGYVIYNQNALTNTFEITNVDTLGVNSESQNIGTLNTVQTNNAYSISNDGKKLAQGLVIGGQNFVEVYDVDPIGNKLGNPLLIDLKIAAPPNIFGMSFSPSNGLLYVSLSGDPTLGEKSYFIQVPLLFEDPILISNNINIIATSVSEKYGEVQTEPFGSLKAQVFLTIFGKNYLPYVDAPEVVGNAIAVGYSEVTTSNNQNVILSSPSGQFLTNQVDVQPDQDGDGLSANYSGNCFNAPSVLTTQGVCSPMRSEVTWVFEDGTSKEGLSVSYVFPKLGWNNIKIKVKIFNPSPTAGVVNSQVVNKLLETECITKEFDGRIYIKPSPVIDLPDKLYICLEEFEKKTVGPITTGGNSFLFSWLTTLDAQISDDSAYVFDIPAVYKLNVENNFECKADDKITVLEGCEPALFVPDVFTPNGDSLNDTFEVIPAYITDFDFKVFNRWGEMVFNSKNPEIKWDGRYKGKVFANQLYPYTINYKSKYFPERGTLQTRGSILILK
ncbi:PKD domain-containing protein [Lacihabitans sp. LS3-19]|uniref:PKD domain-containing protein n=1 Tax=Lacihabitans sp. LS3-19 TaxID=2487335 RepID=UPI0020CBC44F|nr:PKD domain-containing protein [Lacihabitans sp. LS3-19]MCP9769128.1 PKD domain-containing protein [Lacihabitans sp. LS3-19]